jgi:hypothetical protein
VNTKLSYFQIAQFGIHGGPGPHLRVLYLQANEQLKVPHPIVELSDAELSTARLLANTEPGGGVLDPREYQIELFVEFDLEDMLEQKHSH